MRRIILFVIVLGGFATNTKCTGNKEGRENFKKYFSFQPDQPDLISWVHNFWV
jgi:hypothetical protein